MTEMFIWPAVVVILVVVFLILYRGPITVFIGEIGHLKTKWFEVERIRKELFAKIEDVKQLVAEVEKDKANLKATTKILIETLYLSTETRGQFPIPEHIRSVLQQNLNMLSVFAIEDPQQRQEWVEKTTSLLQKKQA